MALPPPPPPSPALHTAAPLIPLALPVSLVALGTDHIARLSQMSRSWLHRTTDTRVTKTSRTDTKPTSFIIIFLYFDVRRSSNFGNSSQKPGHVEARTSAMHSHRCKFMDRPRNLGLELEVLQSKNADDRTHEYHHINKFC